MTKIAIWCRHNEDNIIGIGPNIPWHISSDFKRFKRITHGMHLVAGQTTYESFPNRTLPNRTIHVLTFDEGYQVSDTDNHFVHTNCSDFHQFSDILFIVGGASIYKTFMTAENLLPEIIVDSKYMGDLNPDLTGTPVHITPCIEAMEKFYHLVSKEYEEDNIITSVWARKDSTPDMSVINHIISKIENK